MTPVERFSLQRKMPEAAVRCTQPDPKGAAPQPAARSATCSASVRGSCLVSRVSKVACCANCSASTRVRRPTMITLKPGRQLTLANLDQHPPRRPALIKGGVNTDDLPHRPLTRICLRAVREPHPQPVTEMTLQGGVVGLRRSHRGFEQHPAVDRQSRSGAAASACLRRRRGLICSPSTSPSQPSGWASAILAQVVADLFETVPMVGIGREPGQRIQAGSGWT